MAKKIFLIFKVLVYFLLVYSGSFKWMPLPFDLTVVTFAICSIILLGSVKSKLIITKEIKFYSSLFFLISLSFLLSNLYTISTVYAKIKSLSFLINILSFIYPLVVFNRVSVKKLLVPIFLIVGVFIFGGLTYMYVNDLFEVFFHDAYKEQLTDLLIPSYLTVGIFLSTIVLINIDRGFKPLSIAFIAICIFFLFNLGGRGPIFNLVICTIVYFVLSTSVKEVFNFKNILIASVIFIVGNIVLDYHLLLSSNEFFTFERFNPFGMSNNDTSTLRRVVLLETGWESFLNHPIFGLGIGSSGLILTGIDMVEFPHNLIVETLMEIGIFGGALMLTFYAKFFIVERKSGSKPALILLYVIALLYFLEDLKSGSLDSWRISLFWISIYLSEKRYYGEERNT